LVAAAVVVLVGSTPLQQAAVRDLQLMFKERLHLLTMVLSVAAAVEVAAVDMGITTTATYQVTLRVPQIILTLQLTTAAAVVVVVKVSMVALAVGVEY
jgi:hypothetical protein